VATDITRQNRLVWLNVDVSVHHGGGMIPAIEKIREAAYRTDWIARKAITIPADRKLRLSDSVTSR
jgi:hypothetical protein